MSNAAETPTYDAANDPRVSEAQRLLEQKGYRGQPGEHGSVLTGEQLVQRYGSVFQQQSGWSAEECADAIEDALICDSQ
jgi:ribosome-binding protein aMBF1 (putative translation factor)